MCALIVTARSRGDVAPFTGLGQRLEQAGHQVAIAALAVEMRSCIDESAYRSRAHGQQQVGSDRVSRVGAPCVE